MTGLLDLERMVEPGCDCGALSRRLRFRLCGFRLLVPVCENRQELSSRVFMLGISLRFLGIYVIKKEDEPKHPVKVLELSRKLFLHLPSLTQSSNLECCPHRFSDSNAPEGGLDFVEQQLAVPSPPPSPRRSSFPLHLPARSQAKKRVG